MKRSLTIKDLPVTGYEVNTKGVFHSPLVKDLQRNLSEPFSIQELEGYLAGKGYNLDQLDDEIDWLKRNNFIIKVSYS